MNEKECEKCGKKYIEGIDTFTGVDLTFESEGSMIKENLYGYLRTECPHCGFGNGESIEDLITDIYRRIFTLEKVIQAGKYNRR